MDTEETIRFNQLHKEDNGAVGYDKKCKKCGKALTSEEIVAVLLDGIRRAERVVPSC